MRRIIMSDGEVDYYYMGDPNYDWTREDDPYYYAIRWYINR